MGERGTYSGMKKGSRGSERHRYPLGAAGPLGLAARTVAGSSGSVGTGMLWSTPGSDTPPLPTGWVRGGTRHVQGEMCHAGDTLAGERLAHLLCRSLMTRLSSPSPAIAAPWGSAKAGAAMRGAKLALTWHPQTLCPKKRVCPPSSTPELPAVKVRGGGLRHPFSTPMSPHYMGYGVGKGAPSRIPLVVHVRCPKMPRGSTPAPWPVSAPIPWGASGAEPPHPSVSLSSSLSPSPRLQDVGLAWGKHCLCFCSRFPCLHHEQHGRLPGGWGRGAHSL